MDAPGAGCPGLASRIIRNVTIGKPKSTLKNTIWNGE
jgi:hypothetical protein